MSHDVTPVIRAWVREAPTDTPEPTHLYPSIAAQVHGTPQQHGLLPPLTGAARTMFSATKVVAAGVVVALFGSLLSVGVLTRPTDELASTGASTPAPRTAAPTTDPARPDQIETAIRTDLIPGIALTVEEIERGIFRILDDGAGHDLDQPLQKVVVAGNGGTWVDAGGPTMIPLGSSQSDTPPIQKGHLAGGPDGTLWGLDLSGYKNPRLFNFDGTDIVEYPLRELDPPRIAEDASAGSALDVTPDGRVWVALSVDPAEPIVAVLEDGEWTVLPSTQEAWGRFRSAAERREGHDCCALAVQPDGTVWLASQGEAIRYDGGEWKPVKPSITSSGAFGHVANWAAGGDGTLWSMGACSGDALLRHDRRGWQEWNVIAWDGCAGYGTSPTVGPDGVLWLHFGAHLGGATMALLEKGIIPRPRRDAPNCDGGRQPTMRGASPGVLSFDGRRWRQFLAGACVSDVAIAADGSVWVTDEGAVRDGSVAREGGGLYLITPEAIARRR